MERFAIVEKRNHRAVHALFYTRERAEVFLREIVPTYVARGYYADKTLTAADFEVIER